MQVALKQINCVAVLDDKNFAKRLAFIKTHFFLQNIETLPGLIEQKVRQRVGDVKKSRFKIFQQINAILNGNFDKKVNLESLRY